MVLDPIALVTGVGPALADPRATPGLDGGDFDAVFDEVSAEADAAGGSSWGALGWTPGALELARIFATDGVVAGEGELAPLETASLDADGGELGDLELLAELSAGAFDELEVELGLPATARPVPGRAPAGVEASADATALTGEHEEPLALMAEEGPAAASGPGDEGAAPVEKLLDGDSGQKLHHELLTQGAHGAGASSHRGADSGLRDAASLPRVDMIVEAMEPPPELVPTPAADRTVKVQLEDLEVQVSTRDKQVDVLLRGDMKRVEALLELGPELRAELDRAGFSLGDLDGRQPGGGAQGEQRPASQARTPSSKSAPVAEVVAPAPVRHDGLVSALA